jgi:hypothetical protein
MGTKQVLLSAVHVPEEIMALLLGALLASHAKPDSSRTRADKHNVKRALRVDILPRSVLQNVQHAIQVAMQRIRPAPSALCVARGMLPWRLQPFAQSALPVILVALKDGQDVLSVNKAGTSHNMEPRHVRHVPRAHSQTPQRTKVQPGVKAAIISSKAVVPQKLRGMVLEAVFA